MTGGAARHKHNKLDSRSARGNSYFVAIAIITAGDAACFVGRADL